MHTRDLLKTMSIDKVALVPVWAEVPHLFPDQCRAALAWAEEVTNVSSTHASDAPMPPPPLHSRRTISST